MRFWILIFVFLFSQPVLAGEKRNVILFVADGLRYGMVNEVTAPAFYKIQQEGVDFQNSHSLFPTLTTVNAASIATGHGVGDTGQYANWLWTKGVVLPTGGGNIVVDMENDAILKDFNTLYGGNYLNEKNIVSLAVENGYQTAIIGKEGPALIQNIDLYQTGATLFIDDAFANPNKPQAPQNEALRQKLIEVGIEPIAPSRGENAKAGNKDTPGTKVTNFAQQDWFIDVATKAILPKFKAENKPFFMVYWSRDPDGTQHNEGDSLNTFAPGINGETSLAAIKNASDNLEKLMAKLAELGLLENTDIFVTADHGFTTISKQSETSLAAKYDYPDVPKGFLPQGFMAIDISESMKLPIFTQTGTPIIPKEGKHGGGTILLGGTGKIDDALAIIVGQGGSAMIYLTDLGEKRGKNFVKQMLKSIQAQDYFQGVFIDDKYGALNGAFNFSDIGLYGSAKTERPALYIVFKAKSDDCENVTICTNSIAETSLQQGQGIHGGFSRADTLNFMAAWGKSFKQNYDDIYPVSNADVAPTLAYIMGFELPSKGKIKGRPIMEAIEGQNPIYEVTSAYREPCCGRKEKYTNTPGGLAITTEILKDEKGKTYKYYDELEETVTITSAK